MKHANIAVIIACAAILGACSSGRDTVRELTGLEPAIEAPGDQRGDGLFGDAALNYDMGAGGLDIAFGGIKNIDRGTAHSTSTVIFADVPSSAGGTFSRPAQLATAFRAVSTGPGTPRRPVSSRTPT